MPSGPKVNKYTNRHAAEATERRNERLQEDKKKKEKAKDEADWVLTDREDVKRAEKMQNQIRIETEKARRLAEKKEQLEKEENELSTKIPSKVAKRQQQKDLYKLSADYDKAREAQRKNQAAEEGKSNRNASSPSALVSNVNHESPIAAGNETKGAVNRTNEDQGGEFTDRNIGRRARVLYRAFFDEQRERLKEEQPLLTRTQYHNAIWNLWLHNPKNPFAQRQEKRDQERLERERRWLEGEVDEQVETDNL